MILWFSTRTPSLLPPSTPPLSCTFRVHLPSLLPTPPLSLLPTYPSWAPSRYVLQECPHARGVGVTLPETSGGHIVAIDWALATPARYHLQYVDVTTVASTLACHDLLAPPDAPPAERIVVTGAEATRLPGSAGSNGGGGGEKPPADAPPRNNMDLMILDGSFLGGKGFFSRTEYEKDEDNPAFNVYWCALSDSNGS
eukprot:364597-Chlamydomonas_euryale.AAC.24